MKITNRIKMIEGVLSCRYFAEIMMLHTAYDSSIIDLEKIEIKVAKIVSDLQLHKSFKTYVFQER